MNAQKFDHPAFRKAIFGISGTGKTTLFKSLLDKERARLKFIYDHQGEFSRRFKMEPCFDLEGLSRATDKGGIVCFDPVKLFKGAFDEGFMMFCQFVEEVSGYIKGRKMLITDELQKITDTSNKPTEFLTLCDVGRRLQVDVFFIAQAPNQLHNGIQNQLTEIWTFRQANENALKHLKGVGFDPEKIKNLKNGEWLWRDLNTMEGKEGGSAF